jgi:hypothetical protein
MQNETETKQLLKLNERLMNESDMIGWLCTVHSNKVHYPNNPEASKKIQSQLNQASNLICLAYIWALLDEHGFNESNAWIRTNDRLELKAWKHIRHTGAHAPGGRANRYANEFDQFMSSPEAGISGLKQNCTFTTNSITLVDGMNYRFFQFVQNLMQTAIGHCANNNVPI